MKEWQFKALLIVGGGLLLFGAAREPGELPRWVGWLGLAATVLVSLEMNLG